MRGNDKAPVDAIEVVRERHEGVEGPDAELGNLELVILRKLRSRIVELLPGLLLGAILRGSGNEPVVHVCHEAL
jgi:hypothetical protein